MNGGYFDEATSGWDFIKCLVVFELSAGLLGGNLCQWNSPQLQQLEGQVYGSLLKTPVVPGKNREF